MQTIEHYPNGTTYTYYFDKLPNTVYVIGKKLWCSGKQLTIVEISSDYSEVWLEDIK